MRQIILLVLGCVAVAGAACAEDLADICRACTGYDVALHADSLVRARGAPFARTLILSRGALAVDGRSGSACTSAIANAAP